MHEKNIQYVRYEVLISMRIMITVFLRHDILQSDRSLPTWTHVLFPPSGEKCKLCVEKCGHDTGEEDMGAWSKTSVTIYQITASHPRKHNVYLFTFSIIP